MSPIKEMNMHHGNWETADLVAACYMLSRIVTWEQDHGLDVTVKRRRLERLVAMAVDDGFDKDQAAWLLEDTVVDHSNCHLCEASVPLVQHAEG